MVNISNLMKETAMSQSDKITFQVDDMTCSHCVKTITNAVEDAFPGARVETDLSSHKVSIIGPSDANKLKTVIEEAGYTPKTI